MLRRRRARGFRRIRPGRGNLPHGFGNRSHSAADVVIDLVGAIVFGPNPGARFDTGDVQPGARQWQDRYPAGRAQPDHGDIHRL
jgi:hypothetical protein